jgi:chromatin structure-remodeling complex subunit SFH1
MFDCDQLDVQIGTLHLRDRIEWDLTSTLTPELFAATLVRDLSLPTSANPIISHALHEEIYRLKKSCLEMGLIGADDWQLRRKGSKPLEGIWREWTEAQTFGPIVQRLTIDELDKVEAERERASRSVHP